MLDKYRLKQEFNPTRAGLWLNSSYLIRRTISQAIKENSPQLEGKLLDYGCGSRPYEQFFPGGEYIGVDIEVSGHPPDRKRPDFFFDGLHLPFEDEAFDSVLASEVFEHVFNLNECLTEIHRVMKPGGKLLITCPFVWPLHEEPYDYARYTPYALKQELERAGFQIRKFTRAGNAVEVVGQMFIIEILPRILYFVFRSPRICEAISIPFVGLVAGTSRLLSRLFKSEPQLYLTNVVLAEKPTTFASIASSSQKVI